MGRDETLLQRIARWGGQTSLRPTGPPSTQEDVDALLKSVRWHLERLMNSRHGMSEALADYGLPSLTDLVAGGMDNVAVIQSAITQTVKKYEPRLKQVEVNAIEHENAPHMLAFRIEGAVASQSGPLRVYFDTTIRGDGRFSVMD